MENPRIDQILILIDGALAEYESSDPLVIEESARHEVDEMEHYGDISSEEAAHLYAEWLRKYHRPRPDFRA